MFWSPFSLSLLDVIGSFIPLISIGGLVAAILSLPRIPVIDIILWEFQTTGR